MNTELYNSRLTEENVRAASLGMNFLPGGEDSFSAFVHSLYLQFFPQRLQAWKSTNPRISVQRALTLDMVSKTEHNSTNPWPNAYLIHGLVDFRSP
jgi:hypothetical protein